MCAKRSYPAHLPKLGTAFHRLLQEQIFLSSGNFCRENRQCRKHKISILPSTKNQIQSRIYFGLETLKRCCMNSFKLRTFNRHKPTEPDTNVWQRAKTFDFNTFILRSCQFVRKFSDAHLFKVPTGVNSSKHSNISFRSGLQRAQRSKSHNHHRECSGLPFDASISAENILALFLLIASRRIGEVRIVKTAGCPPQK